MLGFAPIAVTPLGAPSPNEAFTLQAQSGTYALSMQGAAKLITDIYPSGTYTVNGRAVGLSAGRPTQANSGTFLLEGQDITFDYGYGIVLPSGTFTLTGNALVFDTGFGMVLDSQAYTVTGQDVALNKDVKVSADSGVFTLTGYDVTRRISEIAEAGTFALTVNDASLFANYRLPVTVESYSITGNEVDFRGWFTPFIADEVWTEVA